MIEASTGAPATAAPPPRPQPAPPDPLRQAAIELEAVFLAEMLGAAGLGATPDAFGGGEGESQISSMLRQEQARALAESGGIGLAESIHAALLARAADE